MNASRPYAGPTFVYNNVTYCRACGNVDCPIAAGPAATLSRCPAEGRAPGPYAGAAGSDIAAHVWFRIVQVLSRADVIRESAAASASGRIPDVIPPEDSPMAALSLGPLEAPREIVRRFGSAGCKLAWWCAENAPKIAKGEIAQDLYLDVAALAMVYREGKQLAKMLIGEVPYAL